VILAVGVAMAAADAAAGAVTIGSFKTPSHNVVCTYIYGRTSGKPIGVCGLKSGLMPPPPHRDCHGDGSYTDKEVELQSTGRASEPSCAGDPGPLADETKARVLRYGHTWHHSGLRCSSAVKGLTCTNKSGNGFFLSRAHSRRF
jgi:hypothetical protein